MAKKVELLINGSPYTVWCNDGDEEKIIRLGTELEARTSKVSRSLRPDSEAHAFFLTALLLLGELQDQSLKDKEAEGKIQQEFLDKVAQEEDYKKEIHSLETSLSIARRQVGILADKVESILAEVKANAPAKE